MPTRLAFERSYDLEQAARKRYAAAVEAAGDAKRKATDAAFAARDAVFNQARDANIAARRARPRDETAIAMLAADMEAAKKLPAPDLTSILAVHAAATKVADDVLAAEIQAIRRRLHDGDQIE